MTTLDPSPAALAAAEADWRATPPDLAGWVSLSRDTSRLLQEEYVRRGEELDRLRARIGSLSHEASEAARARGVVDEIARAAGVPECGPVDELVTTVARQRARIEAVLAEAKRHRSLTYYEIRALLGLEGMQPTGPAGTEEGP